MVFATNPPLPLDSKHTKSSVLRSFLGHKRTPSAGAVLSTTSSSTDDLFIASSPYSSNHQSTPYLPSDNSHTRALGELHHNHQTHTPLVAQKTRDDVQSSTGNEGKMYMHKKTLSSISLKSLARRDNDKEGKPKDKECKPKKVKSSTNLGKLLSRPKSSKSLAKQAAEDEARDQKNKENQKPERTSTETPTRPPIYAQFSSERFAKQPSGGIFLEEKDDIFTPPEQNSGKQRDFGNALSEQSTLTRRDEGRSRPMSTYLPSSFSVQDIARKVSAGSTGLSSGAQRPSTQGKRPGFDRTATDTSAKSEKQAPNRGQRVLAAVSGIGAKSKGPEAKKEVVIQDKDVEKEFEAMLDRRNIPAHQRGKMRSLAMSMKKDFIKQDWAEIEAAKNGRPGTRGSDSSAEPIEGTKDVPEVKPKRPRSRTFTLSRTSSKEPTSPTKKQRPEISLTLGRHLRTKSTESLKDGSRSLKESGPNVAQTLIAKAKGQLPDDFVTYLRKVQKPEAVEVGKLHKLRLLLRNETVAWTDEFIQKGGMAEMVGLLNRILEVEWREEHEDTLLHENLLCLKALSTTALALQNLSKIQSSLFPALLHMIFDEEKKGPAEFNTRGIITSLLFTFLKTAPLAERSERAKTLLAYLRDPEPGESARPVGFVFEMRQPRPYRVWCKEAVNVTKEVFWIFLHNLNVVSLPGARRGREGSPTDHDTSLSSVTSLASDFNPSNPHHVYMAKHFPQELPPVPAAPYVGGVEWDATNYLSSHLDLVNGILASLPTREERNTLRDELRVSGWEKCMGNTLRTCKEKFYGCVHASLRCWVAAAYEDGYDTRDVRCGLAADSRSPVRKNGKKPVEAAPKIEMKMDFGDRKTGRDDVWL